ncbi:hypothetical protein BDQ17DRAFT_1436978 [Cyathus striatus]|nr:hypothetical protein BDQ17DRAFT_1436978 [Cyathus striatus]
MLPMQGSGAGQAIEDAYTLSHLLLRSLQDNIPIHRVTEAYSKGRLPLANLVIQKSREVAETLTFHTPEYEGINNADDGSVKRLLERMAAEYPALYDWMEDISVDEEVEKALKML